MSRILWYWLSIALTVITVAGVYSISTDQNTTLIQKIDRNTTMIERYTTSENV
ncbi:RapH phosphatase inhibitor [Bacillus pumilus]|uniref:RapH phosphatase inhibitor n=1 Tax=Bacillus pumilus TaxID=1408 RepID=UPI0011A54C90|nr:RapH phosphatase inhibitor [Bacillus pumilus]